MNQVFLVGNTGNEPQPSYTATGKLVVKFSFAVNRNYGDKEPDWFQVECWGSLAKTMHEYGFLGQRLVIRGSIRTESYDKDGDTKYYTKIVASEIDIETWSGDVDLIAQNDERKLEWKDIPSEVVNALQKIYA